MPRYNTQQLKEMAQIVMADFDLGIDKGIKAFQLFLIISQITGLSPNTVRDRIRFLAHD